MNGMIRFEEFIFLAKGFPYILSSPLHVHYFSGFATEYFLLSSLIYFFVVITIVVYSSYGLIIQKALCECFALVLLLSGYIIINDVNFLISNPDYTYTYTFFSEFFISDELTRFSKLTICIFSAAYFILISNSLKNQIVSYEYIITIIFAILGLLVTCSAYDLLTVYLSIELTSLSLYILASFIKKSSYSTDSGLKYFITGSISSSFFLLGTSLVYLETGSICFVDFMELYEFDAIRFYTAPKKINTNFFNINPLVIMPGSDVWRDIATFRQGNPAMNGVFYVFSTHHPLGHKSAEAWLFPPVMHYRSIGFGLIFISLAIKLAAAPFHLWALDVYEGSSIFSSLFFATIAKFSIFVLLIRMTHVCLYTMSETTKFYFLWIGLISVFVGAFGGLTQRRIKTLLAYSSTNHMGYGLLVIGSFNELYATSALMFHLIVYIIASLCTWSVLYLIRIKPNNFTNSDNKELTSLALLSKSNPSLAFILMLSLLSTAGVPPMLGFLGKINIFLVILSERYIIISIFVLISSVIATYYYIRIIKILFFENVLVGKLYYPIQSTLPIILLSFLFFLLILLFLDPSSLYLFTYLFSGDYIDIDFYQGQSYNIGGKANIARIWRMPFGLLLHSRKFIYGNVHTVWPTYPISSGDPIVDEYYCMYNNPSFT